MVIFQGLSDKKGHYLCSIIEEERDYPDFPHFFGILGGKIFFLFQVLTFICLQCLIIFYN